MDVLLTFCVAVAVYILIFIFIIVENRKYPPSIERVKGETNNSESYIVSIWNYTIGMRYSEYCFCKGKDGKYRLKNCVIGGIIRFVLGGIFLSYWIGIIESTWNMIMRNPKIYIPGYLAIFFLLVGILLVLDSPRIVARIYFYKYMKNHRKNKRA